MKIRIAIVLLFAPIVIIDMILLPFMLINWIITGNIIGSNTQRLIEQN